MRFLINIYQQQINHNFVNSIKEQMLQQLPELFPNENIDLHNEALKNIVSKLAIQLTTQISNQFIQNNTEIPKQMFWKINQDNNPLFNSLTDAVTQATQAKDNNQTENDNHYDDNDQNRNFCAVGYDDNDQNRNFCAVGCN